MMISTDPRIVVSPMRVQSSLHVVSEPHYRVILKKVIRMNRCSAKQSVGVALLACAAWITLPAFGQASAKVEPNPNARAIQLNRGAAALACTLRELHTRASLIMFTAHPDDEDGGVLTYESRDVGADTSLFTLNRGEGGQNVMSSDFWDQLGVLRAEELLKADRYYGVHQYWSRDAALALPRPKRRP